MEFLNCSEPEDLHGNETQREIDGYGCTKVVDKRAVTKPHSKVLNSLPHNPQFLLTLYQTTNCQMDQIQSI